MNKIAGVLIIILALVIGILPQFTDCQSQGKELTLTTGKTVPMKCHWTAIAEIGMAVPLIAQGIMLFLSKRKETRLALSVTNIILGIFVVLFPTWLIGVCANNMMLCNNLMKPTLILCGALVIVIGLITFIMAYRKAESVA